MSALPGKYVIGLTGNIGTGKSEVRRMLEKLGAYGIDADALAHQVLLKGEPAFEAVIQEFGLEILGADGQIDRNRLGQVVFADPQALTNLTIAEYAERGGFEGAEVIMWLIMRGALSKKVRKLHQAYYLPSMTPIARSIIVVR